MAAPAHARTIAATGRAVIVQPLTLVNTAPLSFGAIVPGTGAGTVTVSETGTRTSTGSVSLVAGTVSAAGFTGMTDGFPFFVIISNPPASVTLTRAGGGATMTADDFVVEGGSGLRLIATNSIFTFRVGATLQVGANQPKGSYNGTFNMTVTYF